MYPYDNNHSNTPNESTPNQNSSTNPSSTPNAQPRNEYYAPLVTQQRQPDQNGYYHYTPQPQPQPKKSKKGGGAAKAAKYACIGAAFLLTASLAGGGTAYAILRNAGLQTTVVSEDGSTVLQTSVVDKVATTEGSIASVAAAAADSVVEIDTKTTQQSFFGTSVVPGAGSGVIISDDGYIVTNNHVVKDTESIVVRLTDGTEYEATLIGTDAETDLAVIKIEADGLQAVTFADSDQIQVGDVAVAIGNPLGELGGTVTSGIISATSRELTIDGETMTLLQTSAAVNPGNSGGGLFDSNGHLIGLVNAKSTGVEVEGLGFAIPSNTVVKVVQDIIDNGYVSGRTEMGISVLEVNDSWTAAYYGVNKAGVYVADPGENDGLEAGDRFVFIEGESIDSSADITAALKKFNVGDTLNITVERDGRAVETSVTLREKVPTISETNDEQAESDAQGFDPFYGNGGNGSSRSREAA